MFDKVANPTPSSLNRALELARAAWRWRWARVGIGGATVLLGMFSLGASFVWYAAGPATCMELEQVELSLEQIGDIKRRVEGYEQRPEGTLSLSGDEASFILADNLNYPVHLQASGDEVTAQLALPENGSCFNIEFSGKLEVDQGVARVVPSKLLVGSLNLSGWASGRAFRVDRSLISGNDAGKLLDQTRSLKVVDGQLVVQIDDPTSLR